MAEKPQPPPDPLTLWRDWAQQAEEQWNQYLNQVMGSEAFASTMGRSLEAMLALQGRLAEQFEATLRAWNLATRTDLTAIDGRLAAIEERLDHLTDLVEQQRRKDSSASSRKAAKPQRAK